MHTLAPRSRLTAGHEELGLSAPAPAPTPDEGGGVLPEKRSMVLLEAAAEALEVGHTAMF